MPDRDGSTVGGQLVVGNDEAAQLVRQFTQYAESLGAEGLVHLPDVDLLGRQTRSLDRQRDGPGRGQSHEQRIEP